MDGDSRHEPTGVPRAFGGVPVTPELMADPQAGLLDDATRLRHRARTDAEAARKLSALDRVRRDPADLGSDEASAPDVPTDVTARVGAALQAAGGRQPAAHAVGRPRLRRFHLLGLVVGLGATLVAVVIGALMLVRDPAPTQSTGPTAKSITVSRPPRNIPLSDPQIVGLLSHDPDYGPLADPARRASCLSGLGYSGARVLGAQPVDMHGRPGVLMLMPGDTPHAIVALVVEPNCSSAHTGLLADTLVTRP
jgi:hypothetical protein